MPGKGIDRIAEESLILRKEMHRLMVDEGLPENRALLKVLPKDDNRRAKLKLWIKYGLWPLEESKNKTTSSQNPVQNTSALTPEMIERLINAANKLAEIEEIKLREPTYRPRFKGKRRSTSVRLPMALEEAAMKKARECGDANITGNTLGGLTDLLFWRYVECDPSFLGEPGQD